MSLKDKMNEILNKFDLNIHRIEELSAIDYNANGVSENWSLMLEGKEVEFINSFIKDFDKYGELVGCDGKGYTVRILDFELITIEEANKKYKKQWWQ